jgi:hypothetical protein
VWVRIYGIRKELREFPELWAVGSMLGSTQTVDMETTRKSDFGRVFVAVLNPKLIPASLDVVIGDHYFELGFEVEKIGVDENGEEAVVEWSREGDGEGKGEKDGREFFPREEELERVTKRLKNSSANGGSAAGSETCLNADGLSAFRKQVLSMNEEEFKKILKEKAEEILDISADRVLGEIADKVMGEEEMPTAGPGGVSGSNVEGDGGAVADPI